MMDRSQAAPRTRNSQGILIGTARTNPGKEISHPSHLDDPRPAPSRCEPFTTPFVSIGVDALVSIGGDDTLKTANKFKLFQDRLPEGSKRIPVVHLPKTIDNDYIGHRLHVRLFHGRRYDRRRDSQLTGRRRGHSRLLSRRDDGPQRRLAGLRRGDRRRGQPGDQRRRHPRQLRRHRGGHRSRRRASGRRRTVMNVDEVIGRIVSDDAAPRGRGKGIRRDRDGRGPGRVSCRPMR